MYKQDIFELGKLAVIFAFSVCAGVALALLLPVEVGACLIVFLITRGVVRWLCKAANKARRAGIDEMEDLDPFLDEWDQSN